MKRHHLVRFFIIATLIAFTGNLSFSHQAKAAISTCTANVSPHAVLTNSTTNFQFHLTNNDSSANMSWFRVPQLAGYFVVNSAAASGWQAQINNDDIIFTGGSLAAGDSQDFTINATASSGPSSPVFWNVEVSDDPGGAGGVFCDGDTSVETDQPTVPQVSNLALSNLSSHGVTVSWDTDAAATSQVNYGSTNSYGSSTPANNQLTTHHQVALTNLTANRVYHYQAVSDDGSGSNTGTSDDNTFLTPLEPPPSNGGGGGSQPTTTTPSGAPVPHGTVAIKAAPSEKVPPTIQLTGDVSKPFKATPRLSGTAGDNEAVAKVEYTTDGGKNWILADHATGYGSRKVTFDFQPINLDDGNYQIMARATDTSGNQATTPLRTLIIDRLPPQVGGTQTTIGSQLLTPDTGGALHTVVGVDQTITLSAVGGPISLQILARRQGSSAILHKFELTKSPDSGLWMGALSFQEAGTFVLNAAAVDGAGNQTERPIQKVIVASPSRVVDHATGRPIHNAKVTIHYLEPESGSWVVWDGSGYGQHNPSVSDSRGRINALLTHGRYYLQVEAPGFRTWISRSFDIKDPTPLTMPVSLQTHPTLNLGHWHITSPIDTWTIAQVDLHSATAVSRDQSKLIGQPAPDFNLPSINGGNVRSISFNGKPTLLTFYSTWSPVAAEQLSALNKLSANPDINVVPIDLEESVEKAKVYNLLGGYNLPILVDHDAVTAVPYQISSLPTHYFLDRRGHVKKVTLGVLSKEELMSELAGN